ncbi:MAG: hypothetical protein ACLGH4_10255, partial [Actinomycetes bacterium]
RLFDERTRSVFTRLAPKAPQVEGLNGTLLFHYGRRLKVERINELVDDALAVLDHYLAHRAERLEQVRVALAQLGSAEHPEGIAEDELPRRVVEMVYADVDPVLWGAAELSVRAQLEHLRP